LQSGTDGKPQKDAFQWSTGPCYLRRFKGSPGNETL
jgi:hypothetical protein